VTRLVESSAASPYSRVCAAIDRLASTAKIELVVPLPLPVMRPATRPQPAQRNPRIVNNVPMFFSAQKSTIKCGAAKMPQFKPTSSTRASAGN
jgi:hypothetical protein